MEHEGDSDTNKSKNPWNNPKNWWTGNSETNWDSPNQNNCWDILEYWEESSKARKTFFLLSVVMANSTSSFIDKLFYSCQLKLFWPIRACLCILSVSVFFIYLWFSWLSLSLSLSHSLSIFISKSQVFVSHFTEQILVCVCVCVWSDISRLHSSPRLLSLPWCSWCNETIMSSEINPATRVRILDEAFCISHSTNTIGKGMNLTILSPALNK